MLMGLFGFLAFGGCTQGNILANLQPFLCANDAVVIVGFAGMAFAVTMAFPLNIFPIRFLPMCRQGYKVGGAPNCTGILAP